MLPDKGIKICIILFCSESQGYPENTNWIHLISSSSSTPQAVIHSDSTVPAVNSTGQRAVTHAGRQAVSLSGFKWLLKTNLREISFKLFSAT